METMTIEVICLPNCEVKHTGIMCATGTHDKMPASGKCDSISFQVLVIFAANTSCCVKLN